MSDAAFERTARAIVRGVAASFGLGAGPERTRAAAALPSVAEVAASALGVRLTRRHRAAIDQALVLCAEHGLNASTLACRVAASTDANLYACVAAGLAALGGARHGGASARVEAFVVEVAEPERALTFVRDRLRRGQSVAGFGHPLYPHGDPRAAALLDTARRIAPRRRRVRVALAIVDAVEVVAGEHPNLDLGLVALAAALGLDADGAQALFALGRCAGWLAHAREQRRTGSLLRPRARFRPSEPPANP